MIFVDSSVIGSVGYDGLDSLLYVKFSSGDMYTYSGVPRSVYLGLIGSKSTGLYFAQNVKDKYHTDGAEPGLR